MHELTHILASPAHWIFEVVSDLVFAVPAYFIGRWRVRIHDRRVHGTSQN